MTFFVLLIALAVIGLSTANIVGFPNPSTVRKSKTIDTYAAEAVAAGTFTGAVHEVPRGAYAIQFRLEGTLFDATTGDEDYQFFIQGSDAPDGVFVDLPGLAFTLREGLTAGDEIVPTAANAPGVYVPRFVRAKLVTLGTTPIATATVKMTYESSGQGGGTEYQAGYQGG
jgi:hypothetical protein